MKNTALCLWFIGLLLISANSQAQNEGRWYNVEILIFKRLNGDRTTTENWRQDIQLKYPEKYRYPSASSGENFGLLSSEDLLLGNYNYALRKQENYQVLFHKAWKQQMQNEQQSPAIIVGGGKTIDNQQELTGSIKIHIARYLHLTTDLWLTHFSPATVEQQWPRIPLAPGNNQPLLKSSLTDKSYLPVATMREKRRMRSNELHYIDHPLMGILVLITPIK